MDAYFNAYKARYEILDGYIRHIRTSQYVKTMDIFIDLDDMLHKMHRPNVNKEFQLCGIDAMKQCCANIINVAAHYKRWAANQHISAKIYLIYTTGSSFKNSIYLPEYRRHYTEINSPGSIEFFFINDAVSKALPIARTICEYVDDIFMVDSQYIEPSIVPFFLKEEKIANSDWSMMISRDQYDLQYAYRDKWIFVSPKGDNTRIVNRSNLWTYMGEREHIKEIGHNASFYHHNLFSLGLTVAGNTYRGIPRLRRIGWKTIFKYLEQATESETDSLQVVFSRLNDLLVAKGVEMSTIENNMSTVGIDLQTNNMNSIDKSMIVDQLKYVSDHAALSEINAKYFEQYPINIPFLVSNYKNGSPFIF